MLTEGEFIAASSLAPTISILDELVQETFAIEFDQSHLVFAEIQGVLGVVVATGQRIWATGVFIGGVLEFRFARSLENLRQLALLGSVTVLDCPVVIWSDADHRVVASGLAFELVRHVDRDVVHDRRSDGALTFDAVGIDILERQGAGGFEVMSQAERVADFVRDEFRQQWSDERLRHAVEHLFLGLISFLFFRLGCCSRWVLFGQELSVLVHEFQCQSGHRHVHLFAVGRVAITIDLASPSEQAIERRGTHELRIELGQWMTGIGELRLQSVNALQVHLVGLRGQSNPWIPRWVGTEPSDGLCGHPFHSDIGHQVMVLEVKVSDPAVGQHHVGIENLAGHWMHAAWANRGTDVVVEPTDEVVLNIFRIQIHGGRCAWVLVEDLDRIGVTDLLEGFVPILDTLFNPAAVANWCGVFDVETNRGYRWADL